MRILARRDSADVRLITRHGNDFTRRFSRRLAIEAPSTATAEPLRGIQAVIGGDKVSAHRRR